MKAIAKLFLIWICFLGVSGLMPFSTSFAQEAKDIQGWNGARWGMPETELNTVFKDITRSGKREYFDKDKIYRETEITKYEINGVDFKVLFEMGSDDNKLRRVRLVHQSAIPSQFSDFEQLLSGKYGPPMQKDESGSRGSRYEKKSSWFLPSTTIELVYIDVPRFFTMLNIVYIDRSFLKGDMNKL